MRDRVVAEAYAGVGIGILGVALLGGGWAMYVLIGFSALFAILSIVMLIRKRGIERVKKKLREVGVDFMPTFLGLVSLGMAILHRLSWHFGVVVEIGAFLYLYLRIYKAWKQQLKSSRYPR